jgi:hypothetical protein
MHHPGGLAAVRKNGKKPTKKLRNSKVTLKFE